ncbi:DsbC family protein [Novosphingopyxis sp.]|uniref:DsbC family protein n=1 Tax=Novosphingopyxis sp. TaxID=2709690 RepID=UPI003B5CBFDC
MTISRYSNHRLCGKTRAAAIALALASGIATTGLAVAAVTSAPARASELARDVTAAIKLRLPKTPVSSLTCKGFGGLCEVVSGKTLFYVDRHARFLVVGRLYDMETRRDLTAARLLEINPDMLAGSAPSAEPTEQTSPKPASQKVSLESLPAHGAIHWGDLDGPRLVVFSDFKCGYCQKLTAELAKTGVHVEERPISIFGLESRALSEAVLCAADPVAALHGAYAGTAPKREKGCTPKGLDANEAFAEAHGFSGTPVMVRASDGAVLQGYRGAAEIRRFMGLSSRQDGLR